MVILLSGGGAAAAYLGLRMGQVFEAAIPIAIIAVGLTSALGKEGGLWDRTSSSSPSADAQELWWRELYSHFQPYTYIGVEVNFMQMFLSSLLGGILGILFLIPFRKYFVKEMHGKYPFPEATATTQILVSGEGGGKGRGKTLIKRSRRRSL